MNAIVRIRLELSVLALLFGANAAAQTIAISAGAVIDAETGRETINQTILIESGKIKEIGSAVAVPKDAVRIDLSRRRFCRG
jgi:imidazolonepropionase-like amidohydrolase